MVASVVAGVFMFTRCYLLNPDAPRLGSWDSSPFLAMLFGQLAHAPAAIG